MLLKTKKASKRYCRNCSYNLQGLEQHVCPECGLAFDPDRRSTYRRHVKHIWYWILFGRACLTVLALLLLGALWVYSIHYQEEAARKRISQIPGIRHWTEPWGPEWLKEMSKEKGWPQIQKTVTVWLEDASDTKLASLRGMNYLREVSIGGNDMPNATQFPTITKQGIKHLRRRPELAKLSIRNANISDRGMSELSRMRKLNKLELIGCQISPSGMSEISQLDNLNDLCVRDCGLTEAHFSNLSASTQVKQLTIWMDKRLTDEGFKHIEKMKNLRSLSLLDLKLTAEGLKPLANLENLRVLAALDVGFSDELLQDGFTKLIGLDLSGQNLTDQGLKRIGQFKNLQTLDIDNTKITDAGMKHLTNLKKLRAIRLNTTQATHKGIAPLLLSPNLKECITSKKQVPILEQTKMKQQRPDIRFVFW